MNKERLMTVLIQPHISEKAATATEKASAMGTRRPMCA